MTDEEKIELKKTRSRKKMLEAGTKEEEVEGQLELMDEEMELAALKKKEAEDKKKKLLEEQVRLQNEIRQMNQEQRKARFAAVGGWLKGFATIVAFPIIVLGKIFGDNEFVAAFLDKSKIKEKDNYDKATAKATEQMVKNMNEIYKKLESINKNLTDEKSK